MVKFVGVGSAGYRRTRSVVNRHCFLCSRLYSFVQPLQVACLLSATPAAPVFLRTRGPNGPRFTSSMRHTLHLIRNAFFLLLPSTSRRSSIIFPLLHLCSLSPRIFTCAGSLPPFAGRGACPRVLQAVRLHTSQYSFYLPALFLIFTIGGAPAAYTEISADVIELLIPFFTIALAIGVAVFPNPMHSLLSLIGVFLLAVVIYI